MQPPEPTHQGKRASLSDRDGRFNRRFGVIILNLDILDFELIDLGDFGIEAEGW